MKRADPAVKSAADAPQTKAAAERTAVLADQWAFADRFASADAPRMLQETMAHSPRLAAQRALIAGLHDSPRMVAQRRQMHGMWGGAAQRQSTRDEEPLQCKFELAQRQAAAEHSAQMTEGVPVNDDAELEHEADVMGAKATARTMRLEEDGNWRVPGTGVRTASAANTTGQRKRGIKVAPLQDRFSPVQRAVIPNGGIDGLAAPLNTAELAASKLQIDAMWNGGKRTGLRNLYAALGQAHPETSPENNRALRDYIDAYLGKRREDDALAGNSGFLERQLFDLANRPGDETGVVNLPGRGEQPPAHPTALQTHALNVRSWQIGDIVDGVSWSTLGRHLQGRMTALDYAQLGNDILARRDLQNGTNNQALATALQKTQIAQQSLLRVTNEIGVALDNLPTREGVSYRAATAAAGVYGSAINVGDYIKDMAFWSTAGLRMSHTGQEFGSEGTLPVPKVYYIVNGSSGVFVPRYTNKEVGVREILYKNETIFRVTKITNYADRTFFVWVTETDPATLTPHQVTKNPWSGANNP